MQPSAPTSMSRNSGECRGTSLNTVKPNTSDVMPLTMFSAGIEADRPAVR